MSETNRSRGRRLTPNFTLAEFVRDTDPIPSDAIIANLQRVADRLQVIRDYYNRPIKITSGYRTAEHNRQVGGTPNSYHLQGMAVDFVVEGVSARQVQNTFKHWFGGMGRGVTFTHLDIRPYRARWSY